MKKIITELKENKLLFLLVIIAIIFTIIGILFPSFLSESNKELIKTNITGIIKKINTGDFNYLSALISSSSNNILITVIIWILGMSFIGIPLIIIIYAFKCFITGFSLTSILITFGIKGSLTAIIYTIPNICNMLGSLLLSYYSISFSITIYKCIFKKENKNWTSLTRRYIKIGIFFLFYSIVISIIESYVIPNILTFL